ncbi:MAG: hypothetical protein AB7Q16_20860 [Vicinamibacterales bacterium]
MQLAAACVVAAMAATTLVRAQGVVGVFFTEGWESGSAAGSFNSQSYGRATSSQFSVQGGVRAAGSWALQHRLTAGMTGADIQYATQHFGDAITGPVVPAGAGQHFFDIYVQYKIYYSPGFDVSNIDKQLIIGTQDNARHDNPCCNPWVAHYLTVFPVLGTRDLVAEANNKQAASGQWLGFRQNASGYGPGNRFTTRPGEWHTIEVRRRLNDAGVDNGIFQLWIDGTLLSDYRNVRYRVPINGSFGANFEYGTNFAMISDYTLQPVTRDEIVYYDDIKFSTTYIGVGSSPPLPSAPGNLRIIPPAPGIAWPSGRAHH